MIHVFVGTKAQFIKTAPVMHELDSRGLEYNFIDAGQHSGLTPEIVREFGLKSPDVVLRQGRQSIVSLSEAILWSMFYIFVNRKIRVIGALKSACHRM